MVAKGSEEIFSIDDLLDFSNDKAVNGASVTDNASIHGETVDDVAITDGKLDGGFDKAKEKLKGKVEGAEERSSAAPSDVSLYGELCEPHEQLAELEWVSNFLDESLSPEDNKKLQLIRGTHTQSVSVSNSFSGSGFDSGSAFDSGSGFDSGSISSPETILQSAKPPPRRGRPALNNNWSSSSMLIVDSGSEPARKRPKPVKRKALARDGVMRCTHCGTEKTPQWRAGPNGPKTLCNACGVRYKSGRLVPEYRPAASPTFVESRHSNSHRKVMEMRNRKTMMMHNGGFAYPSLMIDDNLEAGFNERG